MLPGSKELVMKWSRFILLGTAAAVAVISPLAATSEAQACWRFPFRSRVACCGPAVVETVVVPVPQVQVYSPPPVVNVVTPRTFVSVMTQRVAVDVQTPFTQVHVQAPLAPLARNFSVYYREGGSNTWQRYGSYALMFRARNVAADLGAKGWETQIR
jgi:hypothetical protein